MSSLYNRVVHTNVPSIKGYVRKVNDHRYFWTLKDWEPTQTEGEPPEIMSHGYTDTPREAFQELYREIEHYTLSVIRGEDNGE